MNTLRPTLVGLSVAGLLATASSVFAVSTDWNGSTGDWFTGGNWSNGVPNLNGGDVAKVGSGTAQYNPGGDLSLGSGGTLNLEGGTFEQIVGGAWIKIGTSGTGTVNVSNGGSFKSGTATNVFIGNGGTGVVTVNGGSFITNTNVIVASGSSLTSSGASTVTIVGNLEVNGSVSANGGSFSYSNLVLNSGGSITLGGASVSQSGNLNVGVGRNFTVSGGTLALNGELKPTGGNIVISGGTVTANLISFDGVPIDTVPLTLSGGSLQISGTFNDGIWNSAGSYVNFTSGSGAELIFTSVSSTAISNLLGTTIRVNGGSDISDFIVNSYGGTGAIVTLASAIPEPSTYAAVAGLAVLGLVTVRRRRKV